MKFYLILFCLIAVFAHSCGLYCYTDNWIISRTVHVGEIKNNIDTHSPDLNLQISESLKEKIRHDGGLRLVDKDGRINISGSITDYQIKPFVIGKSDNESVYRVTLTMDISKQSEFDDNKISKYQCIAYADYPGSRNFGEIRDSINNNLALKMADEIYYKCFMKW